MKSRLKPPGTKRLKLNCDEPLSTSAFKFNLRQYTVGVARYEEAALRLVGRGLHSSTFRLNLSALYGKGGACRDGVARLKGLLGGV